MYAVMLKYFLQYSEILDLIYNYFLLQRTVPVGYFIKKLFSQGDYSINRKTCLMHSFAQYSIFSERPKKL